MQLRCVSQLVDLAKFTDAEELHEAHPGISWMKSLVRCQVWWRNIDSDIELLVKSYYIPK